MGRPHRWRCSSARSLVLACLGLALAEGLRIDGQRSLTCDVSDSAASTDPGLSMVRQGRRELLPLCEPLARKEREWASTNCSIDEGPLEFQNATRDYWENGNASCPLTSEGFRRASAPEGHEGARLRLRRALKRLLNGEDLYITVLGGSMTAGHRSTRAWPDRLEDLFRKLQFPVDVVNHAQGGTTSRWVLANWGSLSKDLHKSHLILIDYGINDQGKNFDFRTFDGLGDQVVAGVYKDLVKMLLSLPNKPAVVDIETFKTLNLMTMARLKDNIQQEKECNEEESPISSYRHWAVNKEMDVPTISYPEAVCASGRTYWIREAREGHPLKDADENSLQHPGSVTHDLFAKIVRGVLLQEMEEVCTAGVHGSDYPEDLADKVGNHIKCLANPVTYYDARHGVDAFQPADGQSMGWMFKEDARGKPGWISMGGSAASGGQALLRHGQISFDVSTETGWMQVEFLGTYENIGFVSVWLDDQEPTDDNSCRLDGLWLERTSESRFALMKSKLPPGKHRLHFRAYGMKFKLMGIATC